MERNENVNSKKSSSQCRNILEHLKHGFTITALEALDEFGCFRLASRISDLKKGGVPIDSKYISLSNGKRVKQYYLKDL